MKTNRARLKRWQLSRAKEVDDSLRERAFIDVPEQINGVTVRQLTLRHLNILFKIQSPFIYGGVRKIEDIMLFLWIVSPHYSQERRYVVLPRRKLLWRRLVAWARRQEFHIPTVRELFVAELVIHPRFEHFSRGIDRYIYRTFLDTPPSVKEAKAVSTAYAASVIHKLASSYGWEEQTILDMPLTRVFQYLKWIQVEDNPKTPQFDPMQNRIEQKY